jgi:hypothetical protein
MKTLQEILDMTMHDLELERLTNLRDEASIGDVDPDTFNAEWEKAVCQIAELPLGEQLTTEQDIVRGFASEVLSLRIAEREVNTYRGNVNETIRMWGGKL